MSDQLENLKPEDVSGGDRPLSIPAELPVLPLRDTVLFPNSFMPLAVARESSVRLIDDAIANGKLIAVFTQRDASVEEPVQADLYAVGTATHIHKMFKLPDGSLRLIVQGLSRLTLDEVVSTQRYARARVSAAVEGTADADALEIDALARNIKTNFQQVVSLSPLLSDDLQTLATNIAEPGRLADFIASSLSTISTGVKQEVLETLDIRARMDSLNRILIKELEVLELGSKIQSQVQSEVGKNQREYFLREQIKAIQKEVGEGDDQTKEIEELQEKVEAAGMPERVKKEGLRELDRLSQKAVASPERTVSRTPPDCYRRAAGPGDSAVAPRRIEDPRVHPRRDRQARIGFRRRPLVGAARSARPGAEQHVPRSLSGRAVRSVRGAVHHDRQRPRS